MTDDEAGAQAKVASAEQLAEARAGVADALAAGASFKDVVREAAAYGVKLDEAAALGDRVERTREREPEM